jgi:hypothetical protein
MVDRPDSELPAEDLETIDADIEDTEIEPIAEILYLREDGPWYTKSELENKLLVDYNIETSRPTITDRLEDLMAMGLVDIDEAGDTHIFYYKFEESEWPIPPDTTLKSADTDITLREFIGKRYVWWSLSAILAVLLGGVLMWAGSFQVASSFNLPVTNTDLLAYGLLTFLLSYIVIGISVVVGLLDFAIDADPPDLLT